MDYGKAFSKLRSENGLTRPQLAKELGFTLSAMSKIERGKVVPKVGTVELFCRKLNIPVARFYSIALEPRDFEFVPESLKEQVDHPSHYQKGGRECIDVMIEKFGVDAVIAFCECNQFKYEWRAGMKDGNSAEQDLAKAEWYKKKAEELR